MMLRVLRPVSSFLAQTAERHIMNNDPHFDIHGHHQVIYAQTMPESSDQLYNQYSATFKQRR